MPTDWGRRWGFMDSMPWVGLVLRPFSRVLPVDFQYIGPWLCLGSMLQGAVAAWVARRLGALGASPVAHRAPCWCCRPRCWRAWSMAPRGAERALDARPPGGAPAGAPGWMRAGTPGGRWGPSSRRASSPRASPRGRRPGVAAGAGPVCAHRAGAAPRLAWAGPHRGGQPRGPRARALLRLRVLRGGHAPAWLLPSATTPRTCGDPPP